MMRVGKLRGLAPIGNRRERRLSACATTPPKKAAAGKIACPTCVLCSLLVVPLLWALDEFNDGKTALAAHDYTLAADKLRVAVASAEEEPTKLDALTQLAAVTRLLGHPDEAEQALKQAAPLAIKLHGDTS